MLFDFIIVRKIFAKYRLHGQVSLVFDIELTIVVTKYELMTKECIKLRFISIYSNPCLDNQIFF